jgi:hypothetical protein
MTVGFGLAEAAVSGRSGIPVPVGQIKSCMSLANPFEVVGWRLGDRRL